MSIIVDDDNQHYSSDEYGVLFNKDKTILIQYPIGNTRTSYVIPNSVTKILKDAFCSCSNLIDITIGNKVTEIYDYAFYGCINLTKITISNSVISIGKCAFYVCMSLMDVYYHGTTSEWNNISIGDYNDSLLSAILHCENEPEYNYTFSIQSPSRTEIRHKDGIKLHSNIEGTAPAGSYVVWTASNGKFKTEEINNGNSLNIVSDKNGTTTFTATLYSADGEILATDSIEMKSKAGFFDKIGSFFRSLFGGTKIYEN